MATTIPGIKSDPRHQFVRIGDKTIRLSVGRGYSTENHIYVDDIVSIKLQMSETPSNEALIVICILRKDDYIINQHYLKYNVPLLQQTISYKCPHYDKLLRVINKLLLL